MPTRILIIEDHEVNLELMSYLLRLRKYDIIEAVDGETGLVAAREHLPHLIICDIQLPGIDGYQVVKRLKKDAATADIPLIAVTALSMRGDMERILSWGFDGYLSKPIKPQEFVAQIEAYLPRSEVADTAALPFSVAALEPVLGDGEQILVVDNLQMNIELMQSLLGGLRYKVITAMGVDEAFVRLQSNFPDLILCDVMMQGGSGFDFIAMLKNSEKYRHIPFIFLTSSALSGRDLDRAKTLGADLYLTRPIDNYKLAQHIRVCLGKTPSP